MIGAYQGDRTTREAHEFFQARRKTLKHTWKKFQVGLKETDLDGKTSQDDNN